MFNPVAGSTDTYRELAKPTNPSPDPVFMLHVTIRRLTDARRLSAGKGKGIGPPASCEDPPCCAREFYPLVQCIILFFCPNILSSLFASQVCKGGNAAPDSSALGLARLMVERDDNWCKGGNIRCVPCRRSSWNLSCAWAACSAASTRPCRLVTVQRFCGTVTRILLSPFSSGCVGCRRAFFLFPSL